MKIRGKQKFSTPRKVVTLTRATSEDGKEGIETIQIRVRALPMGVDQKMFELFPEPVKPQDWAKGPGGIILRDPETKKPMIADLETPEWRDLNRKTTHGRMAYILFHGIDDPSVEFEQDGDNNTAAFYEQLFDKLVDFGFTMGDLTKLMGEITGLMNLSEDVETTKGN
jgi:hypothetical protein